MLREPSVAQTTWQQRWHTWRWHWSYHTGVLQLRPRLQVRILFRFSIFYRRGFWGSKSARGGECLLSLQVGTLLSFSQSRDFCRPLYAGTLVNKPPHEGRFKLIYLQSSGSNSAIFYPVIGLASSLPRLLFEKWTLRAVNIPHMNVSLLINHVLII